MKMTSRNPGRFLVECLLSLKDDRHLILVACFLLSNDAVDIAMRGSLCGILIQPLNNLSLEFLVTLFRFHHLNDGCDVQLFGSCEARKKLEYNLIHSLN